MTLGGHVGKIYVGVPIVSMRAPRIILTFFCNVIFV